MGGAIRGEDGWPALLFGGEREGGGDARGRLHQSATRPSTTQELIPPKPKALLIT